MRREVLILVVITSVTYGCLITNCPRGGKRQDPLMLEAVTRECPACGRDDRGRCFGPQICCSPTSGCFIGTPETKRCRKESLFSRPCIAGFAMCRGETGRCAANGICCSQESCFIDPTCKLGEAATDAKIEAEIKALFLDGNSGNFNERANLFE